MPPSPTDHPLQAEGDGSTPTLVLVDDAVEVRTLVRARLRLSGRIEVIGEGSNGAEAIELVGRLKPDLLLLDISMPQVDGLEALPKIREVSPSTRIAMYSGFVEEGLAERTLAQGAHAFLEKSSSLESLADDLLALLSDEGAGSVALAVEGPGHVAAQQETWIGNTAVEPVLREHLERFREVFEDAAIGMATMTLAGRVVRANPALTRLTGRPAAELVALQYADLTGADADRVKEALRTATTTLRDAVQVEHRFADDPDRRLLATLSPVRDAAQRPLYLFLQVQDVTAQRGAEEELRLSEERFRLLVEAVQDYAIFMLDTEGHVASWNTGAQRIKGWTEEEIVGQHFRRFYPREKQLERHPEHELELAIRDGHYEEEGWRVRKDSSLFWAHVTITAVHNDSGTLVGFAKVTRDFTERRAMQREQEQAAQALAEANAALETANERLRETAAEQARFLALTAHELRSPIGVLGGTADLLRQSGDAVSADEREELLDAMSSGSVRLRRLLDDLLTASRIRGSALDVRIEDVALEDHVTRTLASSRLPTRGGVQVSIAPELQVRADPGRLAQIVENLVRNALEHGAAPVSVTAEAGHEDVRLVVRDAGGGVPQAMQEQLFELYATGSQAGTGLGLYIVRVLARAQDGEANYRRDDGAFVVRLPRASSATGS